MPRWIGVAVLLLLGYHAYTKLGEGILPEMLWFCNVATALIGLGILGGVAWLAATGFLFHAAMGILGYALDVLATGTTTPSSVLLHTAPVLAGGMAARRLGYPRYTAWRAFGFYLLLQPLSYLLTPPALNVNLAFAIWGPMTAFFESLWAYRLFNAVSALGFLLTGDLLIRRLWVFPRGGRGSAP